MHARRSAQMGAYMKKQKASITAGICLLFLSGCGSVSLPETIDKTTISVHEDGTVTAYLVADFDREYYDISELTSMAVEDAAAYNTKLQSGEKVPVSVEQVEMLENGADVKIHYQFDSAGTYEDYMEGVLFYGTAAEAAAEGFDLKTAGLTSVKDGTAADSSWIESEAAGKHVLITDQAADFYCPYTVTHVSPDAFYNDNGSVTNSQTDDLVYILMKK